MKLSIHKMTVKLNDRKITNDTIKNQYRDTKSNVKINGQDQ